MGSFLFTISTKEVTIKTKVKVVEMYSSSSEPLRPWVLLVLLEVHLLCILRRIRAR